MTDMAKKWTSGPLVLSLTFSSADILRLPGLYIFAAYRATLCVRAVSAVARCLPVRLSVTLVYCIHTVEDIVKVLSRPRGPIILVC